MYVTLYSCLMKEEPSWCINHEIRLDRERKREVRSISDLVLLLAKFPLRLDKGSQSYSGCRWVGRNLERRTNTYCPHYLKSSVHMAHALVNGRPNGIARTDGKREREGGLEKNRVNSCDNRTIKTT